MNQPKKSRSPQNLNTNGLDRFDRPDRQNMIVIDNSKEDTKEASNQSSTNKVEHPPSSDAYDHGR